mmetsp:Transcript_4496/g.10787  ORF Transcript_4496/g.10787 Transcript_4496/m.10787 type:complete len:624 (-) Transcript_4496:60-1931(-)|eukprot:CAMPEP_0185811254 /NCGR_PEP_ID=MMETSP1322-20130828/7755_1 /TAXON_ID=265543 /ORGANISM="Minutocellus polymorphus, Strain RCC2270" /LENGTH=623 /DNA_ID=CAMNT_0028507659 /DNA_START=6 /DNA_END=1877 /DNA_ORIENTATION=+
MVRRVRFCPSLADSSSSPRQEEMSAQKVEQPPSQNISGRHRRRQRCRARRSTNTAGLPTFTTLLLFIHVAIFAAVSFVPAGAGLGASMSLLFCDAKEIVATNEWQKLGENDTIPAGLHVKMDISTGERWAKIPSDDDDEEAEEGIKGAVYDASINADGSVTATAVAAVPQNNESDNDKADHGSNANYAQTQPHTSETEYDYEMMYRTLSKLPDDEMERYGGLPALPSPSDGGGYKALTAEERQAFEERMAAIWKQRQEEIHSMQEEFMADMPKMLLQRIKYVQSYLENPQEYRAELAEERRLQENGAADNVAEEDEDVVSNIVAVLKDVEYHVADVDLARDFHTLGGWPVLVSLLTDAVHLPSDDFPNNSAVISDRVIIDEIQAAAAWIIGTAVKNHNEFHSWALEDLRTAFVPTPEQPVTVISLLLANLEAFATDTQESLSSAAPSKRQRCLYALGSLIRGNPAATKYFQDLGGPSILAKNLILSTKTSPDDNTLSPSSAKFASKVLGLAGDLLDDILVNDNGDVDVSKGLIDSLTTDSWCLSAVGMVSKDTSLQTRERSLVAMKLLAPYCNFNEEDRKAVLQVGAELHSEGESELSSLEPETKAEFVQLVDAILEEMDAHQ